MLKSKNKTKSNAVAISSVHTRKEMATFIDLPWQIYKDYPLWVPPLKSAVSWLLNRKKHPFWKFSQGEFFLARRGERVVGRIVALIDTNYNRYHDEQMGAWGFFECENDPEAALALFQATEEWVKEKGMNFLRGPLNPSTNYETGLLVQGFDKQPALMMPYNPPYYMQLIHGAGFSKEKDLFSYHYTRDIKLPEWIYSISNKLFQDSSISIYYPDKWKKKDIRKMCSIYHECWKDNWGFVPTTEQEELELAKNLLPILEPEFAFYICHEEKPVGICLFVPDFNPLLKRFNGKLGIGALVKKILYESEITGFRALLFGIKKKYRQMGLPLVAFKHLMDICENDPKYQYAELGWSLEDNTAMNRLYEDGGLKKDKLYRVYRKDLI